MQWEVGKGRTLQEAADQSSRLLQGFDVLGEGVSKTISKAGGSPEKGASFSVGRGISKETLPLKGFKRPSPFYQLQITPSPAAARRGVLGKCFQGDVSLGHHNSQGLEAAKSRCGPPL